MRKLTNKQIREYSKKTNLFDVLKHYKIDYQPQSGSNRFVALCPFHSDSRPSLVIYHNDDDTYSFCCYACGEAGDAFKFIRLKEDDFNQALLKMLKIVGEDKVDTSLTGWYKQLKQEEEYKENVGDTTFAYSYGLGVFCRDWLIKGSSEWTQIEYENNCRVIDELFIEMDSFYNKCDSVDKAELFYNNKIKMLINMNKEEDRDER